MPYGQQLRNVGGALNATVDSLSRGVPFSDRLSAAAAAATGIGGRFGDYSGNFAAERQAAADALAADPALERAGNFAGGALLAAALGGASMAAPAETAAEMAVPVAEKLAVPFGTRVAQGAGVRAGAGALYGLSGSPDLTDTATTARDTALGAGEGAIIGGALPAGGALVGKAYDIAAPFLSRPLSDASRTTTGILANVLTPKAGASLPASDPMLWRPMPLHL